MYKCILATLCLLMIGAIVFADTVVLKDGTSIEGTVIKFGSQYRIKTADGQTKIVPEAQVKEVVKSGGKPSGGAPTGAGGPTNTGAPTPPPKTTPTPTDAPKPASGSASFSATKSKADRVDSPVIAVTLWEKFIESKPAPPDLEAAKAELQKWTKLNKDNAEKIKGVWVGGVERKRIVKQAKNLVSEGVKQIEEGQSAVGFKKIEDALKLYPQSFEANFHLGLYYLKKSTINTRAQFDVAHLEQAIKTLENAARIAPKSSSVWSNLAIGYAFKKRNKEAVETAYKAALMHESKDTVQNLVASIRYAPAGMRDQAWCKPIMENAVLMGERHHVDGNGGWVYVPPAETDEVPGSDSPAGAVWSGSGFFVTADGYLITNHHVATGEPKSPIKPEIKFRVRMDDGTEKSAELIAVDDGADIAVMKIQPDAPVVPLKISAYAPEQGSEALVLGYPATGEDEHTMEISNGTVKSVHDGDEHEVWFNLNTTHGNSGGPIVDAANNVIAILTAGRESFNMVITLGVSSHQIKTFLDKLGDKGPKVEYAAQPPTAPKFSAETLTKSARVSTVLVIAVRSSGE